MFTPQEIADISFKKATFGGYDMQAVDEFLEPLTQDYITLYKENALLKSKMRVLVGKLEEYRANEASMKDSIINAQKTCDTMVKETEAKCAQMLQDASQAAAENARNASNLIAEENARVDEARRMAAAKISELQLQISACVDLLERIKQDNRPALPRQTRTKIYDSGAAESKSGALADQIASTIDAMMDADEDADMKAYPGPGSTSGKFDNLQFGRNYDPTHK